VVNWAGWRWGNVTSWDNRTQDFVTGRKYKYHFIIDQW
jgi:hypothetical protein